MAQADFIGKDSLLLFVKKQKAFSGIKVKAASKIPFSVFEADYSREEQIDSLNEYLEERLSQNANDSTLLEIILVDEKGRVKQNFTFTLNQPASSKPLSQEKPANSIFMESNIELGRLRAENEYLKNKVEDLQNEILEYETADQEENPVEDDSFIGTIKAQLLPALAPAMPRLIDGILSFLERPKSLAVSGTNKQTEPMDINTVVNELYAYDPQLIEHLNKLLQIAKEKPMQFKMLLTMLEGY